MLLLQTSIVLIVIIIFKIDLSKDETATILSEIKIVKVKTEGDKKYRGTGLAEKMFKRVIEWLKYKKRPLIRIGVMGKNKRAQAFYKKMGFIEDIIKMRNLESKDIISTWG